MNKVTLRYSCRLCGLNDVSAEVPAREREAEPVEAWLNAAMLFLASDHRKRSPGCKPASLQDIKIPMTGVEWIGGPVVN